jgi:hypothetical protein
VHKTRGFIAAGLTAALGWTLVATPVGATLAATAIEYGLIA